MLNTLSYLYFLFIAWILYLAYAGEPSIFFELVKAMPYGDKIGHVVLAFLLTLFCTHATQYKRFTITQLKKCSIYWGTLIVFFLCALEEGFQLTSPLRTFSAYDLAADVVGILACQIWLSKSKGTAIEKTYRENSVLM